jgi:ribosomal protein L25 (general stress protein Ctc)
MENQPIPATLRAKHTHGALTRMRESGQTAVSLSGKGMTPISLYIATADLESALLGKFGEEVQMTIGYDGTDYVTRLAQVDRHPISREIMTVSLQKLD